MPGTLEGACEGGALVVKLSGSLVYPPRPGYLAGLREVLAGLAGTCKVGLVVGGGSLARDIIGALREMGLPESLLDLAGIEASRLNGFTVALALRGLAPPRIPTTIEEALEELSRYPIVVLGGLQPGQSTNAVAAALAEAMEARILLNMLKGVDGVYTPYPGAPGARRLERLNYGELESIISSMKQTAGAYTLFDNVALRIAERSSIRIIFADGSRPENIVRALKGEVPRTIVSP